MRYDRRQTFITVFLALNVGGMALLVFYLGILLYDRRSATVETAETVRTAEPLELPTEQATMAPVDGSQATGLFGTVPDSSNPQPTPRYVFRDRASEPTTSSPLESPFGSVAELTEPTPVPTFPSLLRLPARPPAGSNPVRPVANVPGNVAGGVSAPQVAPSATNTTSTPSRGSTSPTSVATTRPGSTVTSVATTRPGTTATSTSVGTSTPGASPTRSAAVQTPGRTAGTTPTATPDNRLLIGGRPHRRRRPARLRTWTALKIPPLGWVQATAAASSVTLYPSPSSFFTARRSTPLRSRSSKELPPNSSYVVCRFSR